MITAKRCLLMPLHSGGPAGESQALQTDPGLFQDTNAHLAGDSIAGTKALRKVL
jgi:hypothetical protein